MMATVVTASACAPRGLTTAYGEHITTDHVVVPRTALLHLTAAEPPTFEPGPNGGWVLQHDTTGLLSVVGLVGGDEWLIDWDPLQAIHTWSFEPRTTLVVVSDGQTQSTTVVWDGPSPSQVQASRVPRSVLVSLPDSSASPVRRQRDIVAYDLHGPAFEAMGIERVLRIDGVPMTSDEAMRDAVAGWLTAATTRVQTPDGSRHVSFMGAPTSHPPSWQLPIVLTLQERRERSGVVIDGNRVSVPRSVLQPLAEPRRRPRRPIPEASQGGLAAGFVFTDDIAELLGIGIDEEVLHVAMHSVSSRIDRDGILDFLPARQALLTEDEVPLVTTERTVELSIIPAEPRDAAPAGAPEPVRTATRLQLRRYLDPLPTCRVNRLGAIRCHQKQALSMGLGIDVPMVFTLDGEPLQDVDHFAEWLVDVCNSTGTRRLAIGDARDPRNVQVVELLGPRTPCPR